MKEQTLGVIK